MANHLNLIKINGLELIKDFKTYEASVRWYKGGKLGEPIDLGKEYDDFIPDDDFRDFLIVHGCYDEYIHNVIFMKPSFKDEIKLFPKKDWLTRCFTWSDTPEGKRPGRFWGDLHDIWQDKVIRQERGI